MHNFFGGFVDFFLVLTKNFINETMYFAGLDEILSCRLMASFNQNVSLMGKTIY